MVHCAYCRPLFRIPAVTPRPRASDIRSLLYDNVGGFRAVQVFGKSLSGGDLPVGGALRVPHAGHRQAVKEGGQGEGGAPARQVTGGPVVAGRLPGRLHRGPGIDPGAAVVAPDTRGFEAGQCPCWQRRWEEGSSS